MAQPERRDAATLDLHFTLPGKHRPTDGECKAALEQARRVLGYTLGAWYEANDAAPPQEET